MTRRARATALEHGIPKDKLIVINEGSRKNIARQLKAKHDGPLLSASFANWRMVTLAGLPNPTIPHGQGGPGLSLRCWERNKDKVDLMLVPTEYAVLDWLNCVVIHGQPKLDRWFGYKPANSKPTLAISFRWRDSASAWDHYKPYLKKVKRQADAAGVRLLGHGHPLRYEEFERVYRRYSIEFTPSFEYVLSAADVYAADCSSTSFEFIGLDRPAVFLWCPKYKNCTHAPRFTHDHGGITNRDPLKLIEDALAAHLDPPEIQAARAAVRAELFEGFNGAASVNAARALESFYYD